MTNRGIVKKVTFEIEYPNGDTKIASLKEDELKDVASIVLSDTQVPEKSNSEWRVSGEWKDNPTMLLISNEGKSNPFCRWKHHFIKWEEGQK